MKVILKNPKNEEEKGKEQKQTKIMSKIKKSMINIQMII